MYVASFCIPFKTRKVRICKSENETAKPYPDEFFALSNFSSGVDHGNLRELALARMKDLGSVCRDVRTREVGIQEIHHKIRPYEVRSCSEFLHARGFLFCQSRFILAAEKSLLFSPMG